MDMKLIIDYSESTNSNGRSSLIQPREIKDVKEFTQILKSEKDAAAKDKSAPKRSNPFII